MEAAARSRRQEFAPFRQAARSCAFDGSRARGRASWRSSGGQALAAVGAAGRDAPCGRPSSPCAHENRGGACERACSVDRSSSRLISGREGAHAPRRLAAPLRIVAQKRSALPGTERRHMARLMADGDRQSQRGGTAVRNAASTPNGLSASSQPPGPARSGARPSPGSPHEAVTGGSRNARRWLHCATGGAEASVTAAADRDLRTEARGALLDALSRRSASLAWPWWWCSPRAPTGSSASRRSIAHRDKPAAFVATHGPRRSIAYAARLRRRGRALHPRRRVPDDPRRLPVRMARRRRGRVGFGDARAMLVFLIARTSVGDILVRRGRAAPADVSPTASARTPSPTFSSCASCPSCRSG